MFSTYDLTEFGKVLKDLRISCGMTQSDVRKLAGIHEDSLRKIENGIVIPKYETLQLLSNIYKIDLLELLIEYKSDKDLISYVDRINEIILNHRLDGLMSIIQEFDDFCSEYEDKLNLLDRNELLKFKLYLRGVAEYFDSSKEGYIASKNYLTEALSCTEKNFDLKNILSYNFNYFDISILLLLGVVYFELEQLETSTMVMQFCLSKIETFSDKSIIRNRMILKLMYNLSYNYHMEDKDLDVLDMTSKAIEFATSKHILYMLPSLFYRKGIAEFKLDIENYQKSLKNSIVLLDIYNLPELKQQYIKITRDLYNINIE